MLQTFNEVFKGSDWIFQILHGLTEEKFLEVGEIFEIR